MKKWLYLIPPLAGTGLFVVLYMSDVHRREQREADHLEKQKVQKALDAQKAADADRNTKAALEEKRLAREADAAKKAKEKADKNAADRKKIEDDTKEAIVIAGARGREIRSYETKLATYKTERERMNREWVAAVEEVENLKVARRVAELERERAQAMIDVKLKQSPILTYPPIAYSPEQLKQLMLLFGGGAGGGGGGPVGPDAESKAAIDRVSKGKQQ